MLIETATHADRAGIARVALTAGQPVAGSGADPAYLGQLLDVGTVLVARDAAGGEVVGFGATVAGPLGEMLTDLFVDPEWHGRGVGSRLLGELWPDPGAGGRFTFSSGHPAALPLYVRAGLVPGWPLLHLHGPAPYSAGPFRVSAVAASDAAEADRQLTGRWVAAGTAGTTGGAARPAAADAEGAAGGAAWPGAADAEGAAGGAAWPGAADAEGAAGGAARPGAADAARRGGLAPVYGGGPGDGLLVHDGGRLVAAGLRRGGELTHLTCPPAEDAAGALLAVLHVLGGEVALRLPGPHPAVGGLLGAGFRVGEYDIVMHTRDLVPPATWVYSNGLG